jgi:hypothetical protein
MTIVQWSMLFFLSFNMHHGTPNGTTLIIDAVVAKKRAKSERCKFGPHCLLTQGTSLRQYCNKLMQDTYLSFFCTFLFFLFSFPQLSISVSQYLRISLPISISISITISLISLLISANENNSKMGNAANNLEHF